MSYDDLKGVDLAEVFTEEQWAYLSDFVNYQDDEGKG